MTLRTILDTLSFDKQFVAMRYLLLGLMEERPYFKDALIALESAGHYAAIYNKTGYADQDYARRLLQAGLVCSQLLSTPDAHTQLVELLTPGVRAAGPEVSLRADELDTDEVLGPVATSFKPVTGTFDKLFISMQFYLLGRTVYEPEYQVAYDALMYASVIHNGFRKDGVTPEFQHQLEIAHLMRTMLKYLMYPAETLAAIFLHDTPEDYNVPYQEILQRFGARVADATRLLNKYDEQGNPKPTDVYYAMLAYDPIASVAKPGDNGHNQSTMHGVFSFKKQYEYSQNIRAKSWAMMKVARRLWPQQEAVYENLKFLLRVQYNATQAMLSAVQFDPATGQIHPALQA